MKKWIVILAVVGVAFNYAMADDLSAAGQGTNTLGQGTNTVGKCKGKGHGKCALTDAQKAARKAAMLKKWDKDGDGTLSASEKAAMMAARKAHRAEMLKKYDKDGDGTLSASEKAAMKADLQAKRAARQAWRAAHPKAASSNDVPATAGQTE